MKRIGKLAVLGLLPFAMSSTAVAQVSQAQFNALMKRVQMLENVVQENQELKLKVEELSEELARTQATQEIIEEEMEESSMGGVPPVESQSGFLTLGGYVDAEFHNRKSKGVRSPSKFDQHRFVLDISAKLGEKVSFVSELEYEHSADSVGMEQAYIDYEFTPGKGFRVGSLLVPLGRVNYYHDSPMRDLTERPRVSRLIIPSTWFDSGAGLYWSGGSEDHPWEAELYVMNGLQDDGYNLASGTGFRSIRKKGKSGSEQNNNKALTGRWGVTVNEKTRFGLGYYTTDVGAYTPSVGGAAPVFGGERDLKMWAYDLEYDLTDRWDLIGEYARGSVDANLASNVAATASAPNGAGYDFSGWYAQLGYELGADRKWKALLRLGETDTAKGFTNSGDVEETVLGLNFRPNKDTVYKIEYHWEDELSNTGLKLSNDGWVLSVASYF